MSGIVEFCLMYEDNIAIAIREKIEDSDTPKTGGGSSGHSFISDPTCQKAIKRVMPIEAVYVPYGPKVYGKCTLRLVYNPQQWLKAVEGTWEHFRYKVNYHSLMIAWYVEGKDCKTIAKERKVSDKRVYAMLSKIRERCHLLAKRYKAYKSKKEQEKKVPKVIVEEVKNNENEIEAYEIL